MEERYRQIKDLPDGTLQELQEAFLQIMAIVRETNPKLKFSLLASVVSCSIERGAKEDQWLEYIEDFCYLLKRNLKLNLTGNLES